MTNRNITPTVRKNDDPPFIITSTTLGTWPESTNTTKKGGSNNTK